MMQQIAASKRRAYMDKTAASFFTSTFKKGTRARREREREQINHKTQLRAKKLHASSRLDLR